MPINNFNKKAGFADVASRALFGSKALSPEQLAYVNKFVTRAGHSKVTSQRKFLKGLAMGHENALDLMKARYMQGGLLGKGGIILGEVAPNDEFIQSASKLKRYLKSNAGTEHDLTKKDVTNLLGGGLGLGLSGGFMLGYPALEAYQAARGRNEEFGPNRRGAGVGAALGGGLGFLLTGGMGLPAGMLASHLGRKAGAGIGKVFDPAENILSAEDSPVNAALPLGYYANKAATGT